MTVDSRDITVAVIAVLIVVTCWYISDEILYQEIEQFGNDISIATELPVNELPVNELPVNELPVNELPVNELPVNELPVNETYQETKIKSLIPDNYYNIENDQNFVNHKLYGYLKGYTWDRPVKIGCWSFREVTELEHELTNKGCNVTIRYAQVKTTIDHSDFEERMLSDDYLQSHCQPNLDQATCWLIIELNGEQVAYEPAYNYWIFNPPDPRHNEYRSNGKWFDQWYFVENTTSTWKGDSWISYNFIDFKDIYELEEYYLSGKMRDYCMNCSNEGAWFSYFKSNKYNTSDAFLISFGWWVTDNEFHEIETRINEATDWFVLIDWEGDT